MNIKQASQIVGGLSNPEKMPCFGYSIPAKYCKVGARLAKVAGSVCYMCYALRNCYNFKCVKNALELRFQITMKALQFLNERKNWIDAMVYLLTTRKHDVFRWHDSGDIQSIDHLKMIVEVVKLTPNVRHWLPTKEQKMVKDYVNKYGAFPENICVRLSGNMVDGGSPDKLAKKLNVQVSEVVTDGSQTCMAYKQKGKCLDCRMCWDTSNFLTSYPFH